MYRCVDKIFLIMLSKVYESRKYDSVYLCKGYVSTSQKKKINALLRIVFKYCFNSTLWNHDRLLHEIDSQLFKSMQNSQHCINCLLPDTRNTAYFTRIRNHTHELPDYHYRVLKRSCLNASEDIMGAPIMSVLIAILAT